MPLLENLLSQGTVERLGWMLVHCLWQATAVALLLAAALRLLRRADANLRYVAACAALALMVAAPVVTIRFISSAGPGAEPGSVPAIEPATIPSSLCTDQVVAEGSALAEPLTISDAAAPAPTLSWRERIVSAVKPALPYVVLGWLLGVFGLSAWHLGGWAQLQRIKRRMVQQVGPALRNKVADLGGRLGVRRGVTLLESALVEVPTVVGWIRPAILLPASALTGLSPDQLEAILAHELAHVRRYDYLVNVLQTVVEILGFYHPAVWWVARRVRIERENCCDDLAVRVCGNSLQYARALTCMEEIRHRRTEWAVAATGGSLFTRIARVLGRPIVDDRRFAWLPGLLTLALITALLIPTAFVLGAAGPQQTNDSSNGTVVEDVNAGSYLPEAQPGDGVKVRVQTDVNDANATPAAEKASVLLEFTIAKVLNDTALDRETALRVLNIVGETAQATAPDATQPLTAHEVLRKYVAGRELPPETVQTLIDLLRARGYLQIETNPQVMTRDGAKASIRVGAEVPIPVPARNGDTSQTTIEYVECGTALRVTPHADRPDVVTLEMAVELTSVLPNPQPEQTPRVRRRALESTLTLSTDRCFSLLMEPQLDEANETPAEAPVLVMVKPSIPEPQAAHMTKEDGTPTHPANVRRRQVLLDARVVTVERGNLLNLGVEWGWPKPYAGFNYDRTGNGNIDSNQMPGIRLGYTSSREFTASLLAALDLLQENGQADIVSSPQILAQDGRQAQLKVVTEEYFMITPPTPGESSPSVRQLQRIETGTTLTVTSHVGDHNDMTLEMAIEVSDSIPNSGGRGLPVVTRRIAKNAVTIENGGTVALAGLMERRSRSKDRSVRGPDKSTREVAIFVTAHLVDSPQADSPPAPEAAETTVRIPPATEAARQTPESIVSSSPTAAGESEEQTGPAIEVAMRVMAPGERFLKDLRGGARIKGVTSSQDTQALHEIGRTMSEGKPLVLDEERVSLLVKAMQTYPDCTALVAPKFLVPEGEPGRMVTGEKVRYIAGPDERNGPAGARQPSRRTLNPSFDFQIVARRAGPDAVALDASLRITTLLGFEDKKYRGRYPYQVPKTEETTLPLEHLTVPRAQTVVILGPKARLKPSDKPEAVLLMVKANIVPPPTPGPEQSKEEPANSPTPTDAARRQVLLDTRVVALDHNDLANLGVEWSWPSARTRQLGGPTSDANKALTRDPTTGIQLGYAADQALTDSLLAKLDALQKNGRADLLSNRQILAQEGRQAQLKIITEEWFSFTPAPPGEFSPSGSKFETAEAGTTLTFTPRLGDHNDITLEATIETSNEAPRRSGRGWPVLTRRVARNAVTVANGGTVALAGMMETSGEGQNRSAREVLVFVTARRAYRPLASQPVETTIRIPPPPAGQRQGKEEPWNPLAPLVTTNLFDVLATLSSRPGPEIVTDATVKPIPVVVDFDVMSLPVGEALQRALQGTEYKTELLADGTYFVYRPITRTYAGQDLGDVLRELSAMTGVPIMPDRPATGPVYADIPGLPLEKALATILSGTPWSMRRTLEGYQLTANPMVAVSWQGIEDMSPGRRWGQGRPKSLPLPANTTLLDALSLLSKGGRARILIDGTVKPVPIVLDFDPTNMLVPEALRRILQGTGYQFQVVRNSAYEDSAYIVYKPITMTFEGQSLREALADLSTSAGVPIIPDPNVAGKVWADIHEQTLNEALEIMLAGTPYRIKRTRDYYLVTARSALSPGCPNEMRVIPLNYTPPERVKSLLTPAFVPYVKVEPIDPRDPNNRGSIVAITASDTLADQIAAQVRRMDIRPRQALLDMRVVVMKHSDLLDLGIEWAAPPFSGDPSPDSASRHNAKTATDTTQKIQIGCLSGRTATTRMLESLNRLWLERQASIPLSPQYLVQDGRPRRFNPFADDEWFIDPGGWSGTERQAARAEAERIAPEAVLSLTPHIPDGNEITLDMSLELSESIPKDGDSSLPTVIRHVVKNAIRLSDGSTVVWAGLRKSTLAQEKKPTPPPRDLPLLGPLFRSNDKDKAPREVVIFVTAHLIRDAPVNGMTLSVPSRGARR